MATTPPLLLFAADARYAAYVATLLAPAGVLITLLPEDAADVAFRWHTIRQRAMLVTRHFARLPLSRMLPIRYAIDALLPLATLRCWPLMMRCQLLRCYAALSPRHYFCFIISSLLLELYYLSDNTTPEHYRHYHRAAYCRQRQHTRYALLATYVGSAGLPAQ